MELRRSGPDHHVDRSPIDASTRDLPARCTTNPATPPPHGSSDTPPSDPYEILEVARDASPAEITRAYREQMKRYHPDRVAGLGDELQRLAHERAIAIQRAYDAIGRR